MNKNRILLAIAGICLLAGTIFAGVSQHQADMAKESIAVPHDPKKKKVGAECNASSECQRHHSCENTGNKKVCTAPEIPHGHEMPNT